MDEQLRELMQEVAAPLRGLLHTMSEYQPRHYYRDGKPILDDDYVPAFFKWAMLFENQKYKTVRQSVTLYGEKLSTVWLGIDHSFRPEPHTPIIFETMLFRPDPLGDRHRRLDELRGVSEPYYLQQERLAREAKAEKAYPHDQLQLRYATEREAEDTHERLVRQCLVPPRLRSFVLGTVGGLNHWKLDNNYDEEDLWS
jgi:hypothetical protein